MLQSFLCFLCLLYHLYAYYRYSGCHAKIGNFIAEKFDVPHIALKHIYYLRNYLEPKNYLEVPEWQDDSWSGNCFYIYW